VVWPTGLGAYILYALNLPPASLLAALKCIISTRKHKRQKTKDKRQKTKPYLVSCLSLGSGSSGNRMFPLGEEAPGMAHADPARRWHLG
ncbi:MAG: hypothetical protein ACRCV4_08065, partial [Hafnia alvei]